VINIRYTSAQQYELPSDDEDGYDMEDHRHANSREGVWRKSVRRVVEGASVVMAIGWVAGWAMLALLRSS
jgi:S2P endopeptidase